MPNKYEKTLKQSFKNFEERFLIGYTYAPNNKPASLDIKQVEAMTKGLDTEFKDPKKWTTNSKPSLYYECGHVTLQHKEPENLGWSDTSDDWQWLCFGNIPQSEHLNCLNKVFPFDRNDPRPARVQYAERVMKRGGSYSWSDGRRTVWSPATQATKNDERLVEVFITGKLSHIWEPPKDQKTAAAVRSRLRVHPSRGHFYWLGNGDQLRPALHNLAKEVTARLKTELPAVTKKPIH